MDLKTIAHLGRFKDIVGTLFRYGFDDVVERFDLPTKTFLDKNPSVPPELNTWERVRQAMEDLGPTFIKFGQILSLRPDILPMPLLSELVKLQDDVSPVPLADLIPTIEKSLNRPLTEVFVHIDEHPFAAASLAQVHRAVLREGNVVVAVKVQRPNIRHTVDTDIYIMEVIARHLTKRLEMARTYDFPSLVQEFKRSLRRELDFSHEARNMRIARTNFADHPVVRIPELHEDLCNDKILIMELFEGRKIKDLPKGNDLPERETLAREGLAASIKQIFEDGFFHADPHPGNLLILEDNTLGLLDWGIVGRLTQDDRYELVDLIHAIVDKDAERIFNLFLSLGGKCTAEVAERRFQRDLSDILDTYHNVPLARFNMGHLLQDINTLLRVHRLQIPKDLALVLKTLVTAEGTARQLYPHLNIVEIIEPYLTKLASERWRPEVLWRRLWRSLGNAFVLQKQLPKRARRIIEKIEAGELSIRLQHENIEGLRNAMENSSNRLTSAVITAAMIIGSSMIITTGVKPLLFGYPALGIIGYLLSALVGIWLVINIIRSRRL